MSRGLKGKQGLSKEERQQLFCVESRLCSGKASERAEAEKICSMPKASKQVKIKTKGISCESQVIAEARCVVEHIDMNSASNVNSIETAVINAMMECKCQNVK